MRNKQGRVSVLVVAVLVTFTIASAGTATATGITKGTVRQLAAKVVAKQAPTLSVSRAATAARADTATRADWAATADRATRADSTAHADTATTATTATTAATADDAAELGGLPGSAYRDEVIRYTLTSAEASFSKNFDMTGLATGTYQVQWHLLGQASSANPASNCNVETLDSPLRPGYNYGRYLDHSLSNDGVALIAVPPGGTLRLTCSAASTWTLAGGTYPSYVLLTPVDTVIEHTVSPPPVGRPGPPAGGPATTAR